MYSDEAMQSPVSVTASTGIVHDQSFSLATATTVKIFDIDEDLADFDVLVIVSDTNVYLETVVDDDADVGEVASTIPITANVPFILGRDDAYANYTVNFAGGTLDVIETLRIRNVSGGTAIINIFAAT